MILTSRLTPVLMVSCSIRFAHCDEDSQPSTLLITPVDSGAVVARGRRDRAPDPACSLEYALLARPLVGRLFALPNEPVCRVAL